MDSDKNAKDLEEDEELVALRLAALATLKNRAINQPKKDTNLNSSTSIDNVPVIPVRNTASYSAQGKNDQMGGAAHGNQYQWRNPIQSRRGRGRGTFPKINQRSNLIVITPVGTNDNGTEEKTSVTSLVLPQHRWCQSANEDSSSPKTYTKRGPTRFNRHDSETDSSDSDYDNSDNGSYSNETILQDEHSETFDQMTPDETFLGESEQKPQKCSDRRLSFKDVDPDLSPVNSAKDAEPLDNEDGRQGNDCEKTWKQDLNSYSSYNSHVESPAPRDTHYPSVDDTLKDQSISSNGNVLEFSSHYKSSDSIHQKNTHDDELPDSNKRDSNLPANDLRLELKKRLQKLNPDNAEVDKKQNYSSDREQSASPTERSRRKSRSHDNLNRDVPDSEKKKSVSPYKNHGFSSSSSPDSRPRRNWSSDRKSRENSPTRERNDWKGSPISLDRSNKKSTSRSPDLNKRRTPSRSPSYSDKHTSRRNRSETRMSSRSPSRYDRHRTIKCPNKSSRKRRLSKSPDQHNRHKTSRSPNKRDKHQERSHSPIDIHKKSLIHSRKKDNSSPEKSHKQAHGKVSDKNHNTKQSLRSQPKESHSHSSDKHHNKGRGRSKHKRSWSSVSSSSRSPERKRLRHHRKLSRSSSSVSRSSSRTSSSSSYSPSPAVRVLSVVKPVLSTVSISDNSCKDKSDALILSKRGKDVDDKPKSLTSTVKSSIVGGENLSSASDGGKRLPVHMRLGILPRNRVIQMTKDVEAAFVNTSSEDDELSSAKCKKQNFRVVTDMSTEKSGEVTKRLVEKSFTGGNDVSDERIRRKKIYR